MSRALQALEKGIDEVNQLLSADPTPKGGLSPAPEVTRAIVRAAIVLLSGHFERYVRAVSEEAVTAVNRQGVDAHKLSEKLRLQHSRISAEQLIERKWENRAAQLEQFISSEGWLWSRAPRTYLVADRLLTWLKSPKPEKVVRVFELWGIDDIFDQITRKPQTRSKFWYRLRELVEKRNNIAHGEFTIEATRDDVKTYQDTVRVFCRRADSALERALNRRLGVVRAWQDTA